MRIFINTFGSRGDVQPFVALGKGLQAAGHEVMVCTAGRFESFVTDHGLAFGYMTDEIFKLLDDDEGLLEDTAGLFGTMKTMAKTMKMAKPINHQMTVDSWEAAKAFEPDVVIYHPKALGGPSIAEKFGIPAIMVALQPIIAPTAEFPPTGIPDLKLGGWYNKATYKAIAMGYRSFAGEVDDVRQNKMNLPKNPKSANIWQTADGSSVPIMHAFSPHVVPPPKDWPDYYTVNGYWFLEQEDGWEPAPELLAFLEGGAPPVYVGFGSMSGRNPQRITSIVVEALQQAQVRGIIATGWGGLAAADLPETIFKIDHAPHDWLFPRVAAVVHHGGAGTTAAGLRAGRATMICPFMGDQPFWGKRIHQLGVGPEPIPQKKLTAGKLAAALKLLTSDAAMRKNAGKLGEKIRAEDGVADTVALVEKIVRQHARQNQTIIAERPLAPVN